ncbi:MAG: 3-oxoacyl-ACP reductase FabG [Candidatus Tectomicrobia bacterium]|nr:3-oxoacyl-ACP reductase FabG [Candidatus Tectomicrobia bacterium]
MAGRLDGKVAFVTGSAQGIGWAYAQALAQAGAKVVINDIRDCQGPVKKLKGKGAEALGIEADVTDLSAMEAAAKKTVETFGRVDILVNNAAFFAGLKRSSLFDIPMEEWERVLKVNITGTFVPIRAFAPEMKKRGYGKIINVSSAVVFTGIPDFVHYTASKAAVVGMTRAIARELGPHGITVNAVAPGFTLAPSTQGSPKAVDEMNIAWRSIKRSEHPEDIVGTVLYFASPDSDFVTGQTLLVDGGIVFD